MNHDSAAVLQCIALRTLNQLFPFPIPIPIDIGAKDGQLDER